MIKTMSAAPPTPRRIGVVREERGLTTTVLEVVKAHGSLSTAPADAKADLAKAEATVESLVTAAKKAV